LAKDCRDGVSRHVTRKQRFRLAYNSFHASRAPLDSFRARLREGVDLAWQSVYDMTDEKGEVLDQLSVCGDEMATSDGYRLLWYHSTRKAALDASTRGRRLQRVGLDKMTFVHVAEAMAGRQLFRRWANGPDGRSPSRNAKPRSRDIGNFKPRSLKAAAEPARNSHSHLRKIGP
jgi:hypothetical protein